MELSIVEQEHVIVPLGSLGVTVLVLQCSTILVYKIYVSIWVLNSQ